MRYFVLDAVDVTHPSLKWKHAHSRNIVYKIDILRSVILSFRFRIFSQSLSCMSVVVNSVYISDISEVVS